MNKHSADISPIGTSVRATAASLIFFKLLSIGDPVLIGGQAVLITLLFIYLSLVIRYRNST